MTPVRLLVQRIQKLLLVPNLPLTPDLQQAATEWATACRQAAERVAACQALAQTKRGTELAAALAQDPPLLPLLAELRFPELEQWEFVCEDFGQPFAAPPPLAAAQELEAALAQLAPQLKLVQQYEELVRRQAPLLDRLQLLRQLLAADPQSAEWRNEVEQHEAARCKELVEAGNAAVQRGDILALQNLYAEVIFPGWLQPPPPGLPATLANAIQMLEQRQLEVGLGQTLNHWEGALRQQQLPRARELGTHWYAAATQAGLAAQSPLHSRAAQLTAELEAAEQHERLVWEFQQAVSKLQVALEQRLPLAELDRWLKNAQRYNLPIDPQVLAALQRRRDDEHRSKVFTYAIFGGVAAGLLLLAGIGALFLISNARHNAALAAAHSHLQKLLDAREHAAATAFWQRLESESPQLAANADLVVLHGRLQREQAAETARVERYELLLGRAKAATTRREAQMAIDAARPVARSANEKTALDVLEDSWVQRDVAQHRETIEQLESQLAGLRARFDQFVAKPPPTLAERLQAIAQWRADVEAFKLRLPANARPAQATWGELQLAIGRWERQQFFTRDWQRHVQRLTAAVGDAARYSTALKAAAEQDLEAPHAVALQPALAELPLVAAAQQWERALDSWKQTGEGLTPRAARLRVAQAAALLKEAPAWPPAAAIQARLPVWQAIGNRLSDDGRVPLALPLKKLLDDPLIKSSYALTTQDGKRYYLHVTIPLKDAKLNLGTVRVDYVGAADGALKIARLEPTKIVDQVRAPQVALTEALLPLVDRVTKPLAELNEPATRGLWEQTFLAMFVQVQQAERVDPILRVILLQQLVTLGSQGSQPLATLLAPVQQQIAEAGIDVAVPWMDPEHAEANAAREKAAALLTALPRFEVEAANALAANYRDWKVPTFRWVGWLNELEPGKWECLPAPATENATGLQMLSSGPTAGTPALHPVELIANEPGRVTVQPPATPALGRIVLQVGD